MSSGILSNFTLTALQLVEMGMCNYSDFKNGNLNFRDIVVLLEYARIKSCYMDWKSQRDELSRKSMR